MEIKTKNLAVVGDIHGEFPGLVRKIMDKGITDTTFLIAGDCGIGFDNSLEDTYVRKRLDEKLGNTGNTILCLRGNHDDPKYFQDPDLISFPHLHTIPDYTHLIWGEHRILVIGGGVSIDRDRREEGRDWWPGERVTYSLEDINGKEDIVVSHMAPLCIGPVLKREEGISHDIWAAEKSDREYLSTVLKEARPEKWIFGHYHTSISGDYEDCLWRGLDIQEIYEIH